MTEKKLAMWKVLSIDEIHRKCEEDGIECVVSVDAPLVTALNARAARPLFGYAYTPRQIADLESTAIIGTTPQSDLTVCRAIMHITGYSLRFCYSTMVKIREIRRYVPFVKEYLIGREKEVFDAYMQTYPLECIMDRYGDKDIAKFFDDRETAVVDPLLFSSLDKKMVPVIHEPIDNDTLEDGHDGTYTIDRIYAIGNDRQIAECIADLINEDNFNDTAIVLDSGGSIAEAVRSALYRRNIPFKNDLAVKDLASIRNYIRFIDAALEYATIRAGDVRELFSSYGAGYGGLTVRTDGFLLSRVGPNQMAKPEDPDKLTLELKDLMARIHAGGMTFAEVVDALPDKHGAGSVKILLRDMDLTDKEVTRERLTDIEFAVNNVDDLKHNEQIPDDERRGVLLADCKNSVYIDRPLVFFVGLDDAWHNSPAGKDYIKDPLDFENKEAMRLRILLQQGDRRFYIVRPATGGKETVPCQSFQRIEEIQKEEENLGRAPEDMLPVLRIESFRDICGEYITGSWHKESTDTPLPVTDRECGVPYGKDVRFSKSTYNAWCDCPYKFIFKTIITNDYEENRNALFGDYIHDFAELAFCFPELASENFDRYMDFLMEQFSGISNTCLSDLDRSRFRTVMQNVLVFIFTIRPAGLELDQDNSQRKYPNQLIAAEPRTGNRCTSKAETYLESLAGHMTYAKPDLVLGNDIYDWKTGRASNPKDIVDGFGKKNKPHEFQPLIYLKVLQESVEAKGGSPPIRFNLVYFANHVAEAVRRQVEGNGNMDDNVRTVELSGLSDTERLTEYGILDSVRDDIEGVKNYAEFADDWERTSDIIMSLSESEGWLESPSSVDALVNSFGFKNIKKYRDKAEGLLKKVAKYFGDIAVMGNRVVITREYMDRFIEDLDAAAPEAKQALEIPVFSKTRDETVCTYCDYRSACLSPLADDYEGDDDE